jgi:hypothetical protein
MQLQCVQKECILDGVHTTSWTTCDGPGTCNLTQELSHEGGLSSTLASTI